MSAERPKFPSIGWVRGMFSRAPQVVELPDDEIQTKGKELIKTGITLIAPTTEFIKARNSARLGARNFDNDPGRPVNIEAQDVLIGSLRFSSVRVIETQEAQLRVPLALRMLIGTVVAPELIIEVDLRSYKSHKPEIVYEDNRPGGQSQHPSTAEAVVSINTMFDGLKSKLPIPEPVVPV